MFSDERFSKAFDVATLSHGEREKRLAAMRERLKSLPPFSKEAVELRADLEACENLTLPS